MRTIHIDANGLTVRHFGAKASEKGRRYVIEYRPPLASGQVTSYPTKIIEFQHGPVSASGINGLTNEALLAILIHRTEVLDMQHASPYNTAAINHMRAAMDAFNTRTAEREARGVAGTQQD